jgi:two-component system, NtrC family, sensor kinase
MADPLARHRAIARAFDSNGYAMSPFEWQKEHERTVPEGLRRGPSLAVRISIPVALLVVAVFAVHLLLNDPYDLVMAQKRSEVGRLGDMMQAIIHREMMAGLPGNVQEHLDPLRESGGVDRILIIDPSGVVRYGNDSAEVGSYLLSEFHPECLICGVEEGEAVEPELVLGKKGPKSVLTYSFLIENQPECRECHPYPKKYLGQVLFDLHLTQADEELLASGRRVATSAVALILLAIGGIFVITRELVQKPVRALLDATHEIEESNFSPPFPRARGDELGFLSLAFERMTHRVGALVGGQEREIARRTADLEESHQALLRQEKLAALGRMTAGVAHEIGNPMGAISAMSEVIERASHQPEVLRECREIRDQVDRVSRLLHDLTDSARPFTRDSVAELAESMRSARRVVSLDRPRTKRIVFHFDERADGCRVAVPREHLIQVFVNLFANAAEAMEDGGDIRVEMRSTHPELLLSVYDSGPGVATADAPHLFEPFFTTKAASQGTGLGLWVCYTVLERWGGSIELGPSDDGGAEFRLHLPIPEEGNGLP